MELDLVCHASPLPCRPSEAAGGWVGSWWMVATERNQSVFTDSLGDSGGDENGYNTEGKIQLDLGKKIREWGCASRELLITALGISGTITLLPPTQQRSPERFSGHGFLRGKLLLQSGSIGSRGVPVPEGGKLPPLAQPRLTEEEKWNGTLGRSLGGLPAWEPSTMCKVLQEAGGALKSFEALGSAC